MNSTPQPNPHHSVAASQPVTLVMPSVAAFVVNSQSPVAAEQPTSTDIRITEIRTLDDLKACRSDLPLRLVGHVLWSHWPSSSANAAGRSGLP